MKEVHLVALIAIATAGVVHADLVSDPWAQACGVHAAAVEPSRAVGVAVPVTRQSHDTTWLGADLPVGFTVADLPSPPPESARAQIKELPPAPGSAALCLWALSGLGVWHLGRSARKIHLGVMPEWYHTGGPTQVGHATPLDLDFSSSAMPICRFEVPVTAGDGQPSPRWQRLEPRDRLHSRYILAIANPRGPPVQS